MNIVTLIFYNIKDPEAFEKFYLEVMFPKVLNKPGIVCTYVTTVNQDETNLTGVQLMFETLYESETALYADLTADDSQQLMNMMIESSLADFYFYIGKQQRLDFREIRQ